MLLKLLKWKEVRLRFILSSGYERTEMTEQERTSDPWSHGASIMCPAVRHRQRWLHAGAAHLVWHEGRVRRVQQGIGVGRAHATSNDDLTQMTCKQEAFFRGAEHSNHLTRSSDCVSPWCGVRLRLCQQQAPAAMRTRCLPMMEQVACFIETEPESRRDWEGQLNHCFQELTYIAVQPLRR